MSHPSWVCGLKQNGGEPEIKAIGSHPSWVCGLKQHEVTSVDDENRVTPFVGVWIETALPIGILPSIKCHTLRGCVD